MGSKQIGFGIYEQATVKKRTRRFLGEMERVVPWKALLELIPPLGLTRYNQDHALAKSTLPSYPACGISPAQFCSFPPIIAGAYHISILLIQIASR